MDGTPSLSTREVLNLNPRPISVNDLNRSFNFALGMDDSPGNSLAKALISHSSLFHQESSNSIESIADTKLDGPKIG